MQLELKHLNPDQVAAAMDTLRYTTAFNKGEQQYRINVYVYDGED